MSNIRFEIPVTHFNVPGTKREPACGHYADVYTGTLWREVTCGNCKRTKLFRDHLKEKLSWK